MSEVVEKWGRYFDKKSRGDRGYDADEFAKEILEAVRHELKCTLSSETTDKTNPVIQSLIDEL